MYGCARNGYAHIYTFTDKCSRKHLKSSPSQPINYFSTYSPDKQKLSYSPDIHLLSKSSNLSLMSEFKMSFKTLATARRGEKMHPITLKCYSSPRIKPHTSPPYIWDSFSCFSFFFSPYCYLFCT